MAGERSRPNYFILLGLDPDARWDDTKFEAVLKAKISEWSRQSAGVGAKAIAAQKYREAVPDIKSVLTDEMKRKAEAAAARLERVGAAKERIKVFEQQLTLAEARGFLEKGELDKLISDFKDVLSEKEIRNRLKVEVRLPAETGSKSAQKLEPSVIKAIEQRLMSVDCSSLYQLLAMMPNTSSAALCDAADELYHLMIIRQPKDAEVTAKSELAGYAKDIFQSSEKRKGYDESLRLQSFHRLLRQLDESMNRLTNKTLHVGQVQLFLKQAAEQGWRNDEALTRLREHAEQRKWSIEVPAGEAHLQQQRCGNCQVINEKQRQFCHACNKPLRLQCPDCGQQVPSDEAGCNRCGFPVGNAFWVDEVLTECEGLLNRGEMSIADERLKTVERAWMPKQPDERVQKIRARRAKIQAFTQQQQQFSEKLHRLIDQRQFYSAQRFLATQPPRGADDTQPLRKIVSENLARVQSLLKQAQSSAEGADRRVALCLQVLQVCADCEEARALLKTMPPASPTKLQAQVRGTVVSLSWSPSTSRGATYKVVRKTASLPASIHDGTVLATITTHIYDDTQPETGVPLFYAIFAAYGEVFSAQPALLDRPVLLTPDVSQIVTEVNDRQVLFRWRVPEHASDIVVVRKEGTPPIAVNEGTRVSLVNRTQCIDNGVQNGRNYFYGIYCLFRDYDHRLISSAGVIKEVTPEPPPSPVTHLDIQSWREQQTYLVEISWLPPSKGQVVVLHASRPFSFKTGETIPANDLSEHGQILSGRGNSCEHRLNGPGIAYYVPVVIFQGTAYIGTTQRYICVEDVTDLEVENLGSVLRLQWTWAANCQEVLVCFDHLQWVAPERAVTNVVRVSRAEYERHGHYAIRGALGLDYYIVVAAVIRQGNEEIIASGARVQARLATKVVFTYEIKRAGGLFGAKQSTLHLYTHTPGQLPSLLLVSRQGRLPVSKTEGNILFRQPGPFFLGDHMIIPLPDTVTPSKTFGKLYLEDDRYYDEVIIHHPDVEKLRLS